MQHSLVIAAFAAVACSHIPETRVANQPLAVHARCRSNGGCVFDGNDLFIEVAVANQTKVPVGFPLAFRQKTGPAIRLTDPRTKMQTTLRTNPADPDLAAQLTRIEPGESVTIEWVIKPSEIAAFARPEVNITATITIGCRVRVGDEWQEFVGADTLHITGRASR